MGQSVFKIYPRLFFAPSYKSIEGFWWWKETRRLVLEKMRWGGVAFYAPTPFNRLQIWDEKYIGSATNRNAENISRKIFYTNLQILFFGTPVPQM